MAAGLAGEKKGNRRKVQGSGRRLGERY